MLWCGIMIVSVVLSAHSSDSMTMMMMRYVVMRYVVMLPLQIIFSNTHTERHKKTSHRKGINRILFFRHA